MAQSNNQYYPIEENLLRIIFFRSLPADTLSAIASRFKKVHFDHGEVVFTENSHGDTMYLIESGHGGRNHKNPDAPGRRFGPTTRGDIHFNGLR